MKFFFAFRESPDDYPSSDVSVFSDEPFSPGPSTLAPPLALGHRSPSVSSGRLSPSLGSSPKKPRLVKVYLPFEQHSMVSDGYVLTMGWELNGSAF